MTIKFLPREDIDKIKWNSCVHYANNGNIFGYMWYLDKTAREWDGLIEDEYESAMPLMMREREDGKEELYVPDLVRSTGIYSVNVLSSRRINAFLERIPDTYQNIRLNLNEGTRVPSDSGFNQEKKINHVILLNTDYDTIKEQYSPTIQEQIAAAEELGMHSSGTLKVERIAEFYKAHSGHRGGMEKRFHALHRIMYNVLHRGWGFASGVNDKNGNLIAVSFFIVSHGRLMSLLSVASPEGNKVGALTYLMDLFIRNNAQRPMILDFNSTVNDWPVGMPEQMGAKEVPFYQLVR